MANDQPKPSNAPVIMSPADLHNLADRLSKRAEAIENIATRDLANDLRLTSRLISALLRAGTVAEDVDLRKGDD